MSKYLLEVCVDSVESALSAVQGGADRLELCSNLPIGGTTPSQFLFQEIKKICSIRIHILIRPRYGDFCYSSCEFQIMKQEVSLFRELGADGVVFGILRPDGTMNLEQMQELVELKGSMSVTLHRAFDVCSDPFQMLEQTRGLGIDTILTAGQQNCCLDGKEQLKKLVIRSGNDLEIMIGGGVNEQVISELQIETHARAFHMSGKESCDSNMIFRRQGIRMGAAGISEYEQWRTSKNRIKQARQALDAL